MCIRDRFRESYLHFISNVTSYPMPDKNRFVWYGDIVINKTKYRVYHKFCYAFLVCLGLKSGEVHIEKKLLGLGLQ